MHRIFTALAAWLATLMARPLAPNPLDNMSLNELADLPAIHPHCDPCG